ncbi:MAG: GGDEF domain-containing protein [Hyphomicrobiales bacterium]
MKTPYFLILATGALGLIAGYGVTMNFESATLLLTPIHGVHAVLLFICGWVWFKGTNSEHVANRSAVSIIFFSFTIFSIAFPFVTYNMVNAPSADQYQHSTSWVIFNFAIIMMVMVTGLSLTAVLTDDMVKKIKFVSSTDLLTGLKTRRAFEEKLEDIFTKLERSPLPLSIIIADIDHFKLVNDTYGHQTGDRVISTFGKLIAEGSRKTDLVARIGGEEFCIVLWNADASGARLVAENLRTQFQAAQFEGIPKHKKFTSSFGVATLKPGEVSEELYRRADQALYLAKKEGRNRVCLDQTHLEADTLVEPASNNIVLYPSA